MMIKCPRCEEYSATHRVDVEVCRAHSILNAEKIFELLEELGFSKRTIKKIRAEYNVRKLGDVLVASQAKSV
jgi:adenylate cyclase class IV